MRDKNAKTVINTDLVREMQAKVNDAELLEKIKKMAKECRHKDQAAGLVYFINNTVGAAGEGCWRSWSCDIHHWGGSGPINQCPECKRLDILEWEKSG
jgi:hypothetical protein